MVGGFEVPIIKSKLARLNQLLLQCQNMATTEIESEVSHLAFLESSLEKLIAFKKTCVEVWKPAMLGFEEKSVLSVERSRYRKTPNASYSNESRAPLGTKIIPANMIVEKSPIQGHQSHQSKPSTSNNNENAKSSQKKPIAWLDGSNLKLKCTNGSSSARESDQFTSSGLKTRQPLGQLFSSRLSNNKGRRDSENLVNIQNIAKLYLDKENRRLPRCSEMRSSAEQDSCLRSSGENKESFRENRRRTVAMIGSEFGDSIVNFDSMIHKREGSELLDCLPNQRTYRSSSNGNSAGQTNGTLPLMDGFDTAEYEIPLDEDHVKRKLINVKFPFETRESDMSLPPSSFNISFKNMDQEFSNFISRQQSGLKPFEVKEKNSTEPLQDSKIASSGVFLKNKFDILSYLMHKGTPNWANLGEEANDYINKLPREHPIISNFMPSTSNKRAGVQKLLSQVITKSDTPKIFKPKGSKGDKENSRPHYAKNTRQKMNESKTSVCENTIEDLSKPSKMPHSSRVELSTKQPGFMRRRLTLDTN